MTSTASLKKVKIGIIGCGGVAERWYFPGLCGIKENYSVTSFVDVDSIKLQKAASKWNVAQTYNSIDEFIEAKNADLAVVLTRHSDHFSQVKKLLDSGFHVYVEKPFAENALRAQELIDLAKRKNKVLGTAPQIMLSSRNQKLKELIYSKTIGKISLIRVSQSNAGPADRKGFSGNPIWFYQDGGVLKSLGIYSLTTLTWVFGMPKRLSAFSGIAFKNRIVQEGDFSGQQFETTAPDNYAITLDYGYSTFALFDTSYSILHPPQFEFEIHGEKGSLFVGGFGGPESILLQKRGSQPFPVGPQDDIHLRWNLSWGVEETVKAILTNSPPLVHPNLSLKVIHLIDAIETSNRNNEVICWDVSIRAIIEDDWLDLWSLLSNPEVSRFLTWSTYTSQAEGRLFLQRAINSNKMPDQFQAIIYKQRLVGTLHAVVRNNEVQFGFSILPEYQALELDKKALELLLNELHDWNCYCDLHLDNHQSIAVLESLGFQKTDLVSDLRYRWKKL